MNKRLLLALYDRSGLGAYMPVDYKGHELAVEEHWEKFAELIVKECADIADKAEPYKASDLIRKHFGVDDNSIKVGSRVKIVSKFNVGARGTVNYIEPTGKLWVRRDGASSDVSYYLTEVIGVEE